MSALCVAQVCAHPAARQHNVMGRAVAGPALLQIWEVASTAAQGGPQARLALGICLDGGLAWDCKWRPGSANAQRCRLLLTTVPSRGRQHACKPWAVGDIPLLD
jgi:hypothetical protein